jgi:hypothetical protein
MHRSPVPAYGHNRQASHMASPPVHSYGNNRRANMPQPSPSTYGPHREPVGMPQLSHNLEGMGFSHQGNNWNPTPFNPSNTIAHTAHTAAGADWNSDDYQEGVEGLVPDPPIGRLGGVDDTPWVPSRRYMMRNAAATVARPRGGNASNVQRTPTLRNVRSDQLGLRERSGQLNTNGPSVRNIRSEQGLRERRLNSQQNATPRRGFHHG